MTTNLICLALLALTVQSAVSQLLSPFDDGAVRIMPIGQNRYDLRLIPHGSLLEQVVERNAPGAYQVTGKLRQPSIQLGSRAVLPSSGLPQFHYLPQIQLPVPPILHTPHFPFLPSQPSISIQRLQPQPSISIQQLDPLPALPLPALPLPEPGLPFPRPPHFPTPPFWLPQPPVQLPGGIRINPLGAQQPQFFQGAANDENEPMEQNDEEPNNSEA